MAKTLGKYGLLKHMLATNIQINLISGIGEAQILIDKKLLTCCFQNLINSTSRSKEPFINDKL